MRIPKHFPLQGGLNEVTPPLSLKGGELFGVSNYEPGTKGGYRRIDGYERLDGHPSPSEASYWTLDFDAGDIVEPEVGCTVFCTTDDTKAEVGAVILESGSWVGGDAAGYLVLYNLVGFFEDNEPLSFTAAGDGFDTGFSNGFG